MFARNVSIHLKPNTLNDFTKTFQKDVLPMLRKQMGFRDEIAVSSNDDTDVTAISLWDTREQAEAYNTTTYPTVLKALDKFLDGTPKVRGSNVIHSSLDKVTAPVAA